MMSPLRLAVTRHYIHYLCPSLSFAPSVVVSVEQWRSGEVDKVISDTLLRADSGGHRT